MSYKQNLKKKPEPMAFSNNRNENRINRNYDRISAINTPLNNKMLEINIGNTFVNKNENPLEGLIYKSIFNSLEKNALKENINNISDNNFNLLQEREKRKYYVSNKKISNNKKYTLNIKKQLQDIKNEQFENSNDLDNNINHSKINNVSKDEFNDLLNNYSGSILNKDIQYKKQYSPKQSSNNENSTKKINYIVSTDFTDLNFEKDINNEDFQEIPQTNKKTLNYQKSEDNLNKNNILDKQEFMKNIKEINDLEFIDEDKNEPFTQKDILSNNEYMNKNNYLRNNKIENIINTGRNDRNKNLILPNKKEKSMAMNSIKSPQNSFISTTNNSNFNNFIYNKNSYNSSNANKKAIIRKEKLNINNLSNHDINFNDNKMKISEISKTNNNSVLKNDKNSMDINTNLFYSKTNFPEKNDNYLLSLENNEQNHFSTLSNEEIEKSFSSNNPKKNKNNLNIKNNYIDYMIQTKNQNYKNISNNLNSFINNNLDDINNEFYKSLGNNNFNTRGNSQYVNMNNKSDNYNYLDLKEKYEKLKEEIKKKNILLNRFTKIIGEYKKRYNNLLEKNKQLQEESKTKQITLLEKIKEYQKEIYILKNNIDLLKRNNTKNNKNENYNINIYNSTDFINQINKLKEELEKYKKENNNLKILAIKYKNNNLNANSNKEAKNENNLRNRFYFLEEKEKNNKYDKKSYSVSKPKKRIRASSLSKKNFEEGDLDIPSDNNHISSFMLY